MPPKPDPTLNEPLQLQPPVDLGAEVVRWLFPAYIFLILVAFFVLRSSLVMPEANVLNADRAVFTAVNAATLTGFQYDLHPRQFYPFGKLVLLILTVAGTIFSFTVGGLAVKRILRLPWPDLRLIKAILILQAIALVIGATSRTSPDSTLVGSMLQACAALANSGLNVEIYPVADSYTFFILLPLGLLGGLGITVVLELYDAAIHRRPLSTHAKLVLHMTAALYLVGFAGYVLLQNIGLGTLRSGAAQSTLQRIVVDASALATNTRTAGMPLLKLDEIPVRLDPLFSVFTVLLMMIGASPGGTGGGIKTTTFWLVLTAPARILRGQPLSRGAGIAMTWVGIYLAAVMLFQFVLLRIEPSMNGDRPLFAVVSAISNVGLSHGDRLMIKSPAGHLLMSAAMLFGRMAPLLVLWWMADSTRDEAVAAG